MARRNLGAAAAAGLLVAAILGSPCPAAAGDARCLFRSLSQAAQDDLLAKYAQGGVGEAFKWSPSAADVARIGISCQTISGSKIAIIKAAIVFYLGQDSMEQSLSRKYNVSRYKLDEIWTSITPANRVAFTHWARMWLGVDKGDASDNSPTLPLLAAGKVPADYLKHIDEHPGLVAFINYYASAAIRQSLEAEF